MHSPSGAQPTTQSSGQPTSQSHPPAQIECVAFSRLPTVAHLTAPVAPVLYASAPSPSPAHDAPSLLVATIDAAKQLYVYSVRTSDAPGEVTDASRTVCDAPPGASGVCVAHLYAHSSFHMQSNEHWCAIREQANIGVGVQSIR